VKHHNQAPLSFPHRDFTKLSIVLAVVRVSDTTETAEQIRSVLKIQSALLEGLVPLGRVKAIFMQ
tara:strand:+ start:616 stop:810 length:195 start_codon:yes stop_codon:yes gene_type:complete